tara:strand:+ start:3894 stop:4367 length:474 start_codon:yes stop_codon:yes gene_type:complete
MQNERPQQWIPEICYEDDGDGITSNIPFIEVPLNLEMPKILFIFETRNTGEHEPGPDGEAMPIVDLDLHQYANMNTLRDKLSPALYDTVRQALGLDPLAEAIPAGKKLTQNIRENVGAVEDSPQQPSIHPDLMASIKAEIAEMKREEAEAAKNKEND